MFPDTPEKIESFEVVPASCFEYTNDLGQRVVTLTREHVVALNSKGRLWARVLEETNWNCLNFPQA